MSGYAASVTLHGASPHVVAWHGLLADEPLPGVQARPEQLAEATPLQPIELVGRPVDEAIAEWLASLGEAWSQLTFFVFDPDSWR